MRHQTLIKKHTITKRGALFGTRLLLKTLQIQIHSHTDIFSNILIATKHPIIIA